MIVTTNHFKSKKENELKQRINELLIQIINQRSK